MTKIDRLAQRKSPAFGLLLAAFLAASLLVTSPAHARTFTVDSTADFSDADPADNLCAFFGACTLRAAIEQANATAGEDEIRFNISGSGPHTISLASALPQITEMLTINGYSQPGSSPNTNPNLAQGSNAAPKIELDGTRAGTFTSGLLIKGTAPNSVIRGLVINRFDAAGIIVEPGGSGNRIEGNFIGTDPSGQIDLGNDSSGVAIGGLTGGNNAVGGVMPDARNVISANAGQGVGVGSSGNKVQGNYIGTRKDGNSGLGNSLNGVAIGHFGNTVGDADGANIIAFNGEDGVRVENNASTGNRILSNSIFSNGGLGIDLRSTGSPAGPTPNDEKDKDKGSNNLQNFPVITSVTGSPGTTTVTGTLDSKAKKKGTFTVQFFSSPTVDTSGFGEGQTLLGEMTVKKKGLRSLAFTTDQDLSGQFVTATATNNKTGDTSEFSEAVFVG